MSLTTSSWWSTLIPFSRSVLTISKWPSAAALWRAVCPVCNKQSKREIKFHEDDGMTSPARRVKKTPSKQQVILSHANLEPVQKSWWFLYNSFLPEKCFLSFLCFFCSLSQHSKTSVTHISKIHISRPLKVYNAIF